MANIRTKRKRIASPTTIGADAFTVARAINPTKIAVITRAIAATSREVRI